MCCDQEKAIEISDKEMIKDGYDLHSLLRIVKVEQGSYIIHYQPKDTLIRGNEAEVKIAKNNCTILEKKFYQ